MYPTLEFVNRTYTPEWFATESSRVAAGLRALGVATGDTVACMLKNCPDYISVLLATRRMGVYLVPVNWHFKAHELRYILEDSGASVVFVHPDLLAQVDGGIPAERRLILVDGADGSGQPGQGATAAIAYESLQGEFDESEPMQGINQHVVPYTSGTTGRPKGVRRLLPPPEQREERERELMELARLFPGVRPGSVALLSAPLYHSAPLAFAMQACRTAATLVLEPSFDAERTLRLIESRRVTHVYLVPTMFRRLLALPEAVRQRYRLSTVQQVVSTGSPCAAGLKRDMIAWWGPVITESYASSEAGSITFIDSRTWLERPGSAGRPVGRARLAILDEAGQPLPPGRVGLIYARQPCQADFTYVNNDAARVAIERDGLVTLGDMGYVDEEGYLYICDRQADMVISGGVNIYPAEIEAELQTMPCVEDCAVFGVPDDEFGESLVAAVQLRPGRSISADEVRSYLRQRLANYKVPRQITFHAQLPREETGKIFKRHLRAPYWSGQTRSI